MPLHTLDLVLAPEQDARIRERWEVLRAAGLPSQARHRGASNAPHVTVLSGASLPDEVLRRARRCFEELLPRALPVTGLQILGGGPWVLAESVAAPPRLGAAVAELHALAAEAERDSPQQVRPGPERPTATPRPRPWVPHVTLGKRLDAAALARALEVLREVPAPEALEAVALRHWDPHRQETTQLVP